MGAAGDDGADEPPRVHVITYATHSHGRFEALRANPHCRVTVLGWGTEWTGFFDKVRAIAEFASKVSPNDVVIFVDGFDSVVAQPVARAVDRWQRLYRACPILLSKQPALFGCFLDHYINYRIFKGDMNSGMFIGRAWAVRRVFRDMLSVEKEARGDDQRALNLVSQRSGVRMAVDSHEFIFKNMTYRERQGYAESADRYAAVFHSFPGTVEFARWRRVLWEYSGFVLPDVVTLIVVVVVITNVWRTMRGSEAPKRSSEAPPSLLAEEPPAAHAAGCRGPSLAQGGVARALA